MAMTKHSKKGTLTILKEIRERYGQNRKSSFEINMAFSRYLYRPLSYLPAAIFVRLGVSPNQISVLNILVLVLASICFLVGSKSWFFAGMLCVLVYVILDFSDGNVARYQESTSFFGKLLDGSVDTLSLILFIPVSLGYQKMVGSSGDAMFILGVITTVSGLYNSYLGQCIAYYSIAAQEAYSVNEEKTVASKRKGLLSYLNILYENMVISMPVFLAIATVFGLVPLFLKFFAITHGFVGLVSSILRVIRVRKVLNVRREY